MPFGVNSEVGRLRQVMVHRPGLEHTRLTPSNASELLFDDVLWVARAKAGACRDPPKDVVDLANDIAGRTGARITVTEDPS